jgi:hypothetical protein
VIMAGKEAVRLGVRRGHEPAAVGRHDSLAPAAALEPHRDAHDKRAAVEPGLGAAHHAAFLSPWCRSSAVRLTIPSALILTSSASRAR